MARYPSYHPPPHHFPFRWKPLKWWILAFFALLLGVLVIQNPEIIWPVFWPVYLI